MDTFIKLLYASCCRVVPVVKASTTMLGFSTHALKRYAQAVLGTVTSIDYRNKYAEVDVGLKGRSKFQVRHLLEKEGDKLEVGEDVEFLVKSLRSPFGEPFLIPRGAMAEAQKVLVWKELKAIMDRGGLVQGRVLNSINGGYAVGIAGYVGFLPGVRIPSSGLTIGKLHPFRIAIMNFGNKNIVLQAAQPRYNNNKSNYNSNYNRGINNNRQQQNVSTSSSDASSAASSSIERATTETASTEGEKALESMKGA